MLGEGQGVPWLQRLYLDATRHDFFPFLVQQSGCAVCKTCENYVWWLRKFLYTQNRNFSSFSHTPQLHQLHNIIAVGLMQLRSFQVFPEINYIGNKVYANLSVKFVRILINFILINSINGIKLTVMV